MSFDVNFNKPVIQGAQSLQDGGAGNLGYFEQGDKDKKDKEKSIFTEAKEKDTFEKHDGYGIDSKDFSISKIIAQIILAVKGWLKKIFKIYN